MDVALALLCDRVDIGANGKFDVFGVLDRISAPAFPVEIPIIHVAIGLCADLALVGRTEMIVLRLRSPEGRDVGEMVANVVVPSVPGSCTDVRFHTVLELANACVPKPGRYELHIVVGESQAMIPLDAVEHPSGREGEELVGKPTHSLSAAGALLEQSHRDGRSGNLRPMTGASAAKAEVLDVSGAFVPHSRYYWTEEWQAGEREADEDIAAGRLRHFDSGSDLVQHLQELRS